MLEQPKRYYLYNVTDNEIVITLSTKRAIKPHTALALNTKDLSLYKTMKAKRAGRKTILDGLRLSTIKPENDANYMKAHGITAAEVEVNEKADEETKTEVETGEVLIAEEDVPTEDATVEEEVLVEDTTVDEEAQKLEEEAKAELEEAAEAKSKKHGKNK